MQRASAELKLALKQRGLEVIESDVSVFLKAGGACMFLTLEICTLKTQPQFDTDNHG